MTNLDDIYNIIESVGEAIHSDLVDIETKLGMIDGKLDNQYKHLTVNEMRNLEDIDDRIEDVVCGNESYKPCNHHQCYYYDNDECGCNRTHECPQRGR